MKVVETIGDIQYGKHGLTDMPIPTVSSAHANIDARIPPWVSYGCGPIGS
jgi:hypothetical protein